MLALYPLWRKARRVYSLTSRLPGTNRLGFQPSLALSGSQANRQKFLVIFDRLVEGSTVWFGLCGRGPL
ncbi:MAG: hypothetical protein ABW170_14760 [Candidatus Thiodiazotropha sp. L084R]